MQRVSVVGNSGSGKSTVAATLARRLGVPHVELDAIFHQPGLAGAPIGRVPHAHLEFVRLRSPTEVRRLRGAGRV